MGGPEVAKKDRLDSGDRLFNFAAFLMNGGNEVIRPNAI